MLVLFNGAVVAAAPPARLLAGRVVVAPLAIVARMVERVRVGDDATIELESGGHRCLLRLGRTAARCDGHPIPLAAAPFRAEGATFVPLGEVVRAFGGALTLAPGHRSAAVRLSASQAVRSPAPFDPAAPQAAPTAVFTPQPPPSTPRPAEAQPPRPRRTAIPVLTGDSPTNDNGRLGRRP